ncbi:uncharacterized protein [Choristoneura fumiferana]|uniref:uncharacterized protein n=1 Tax=Choristoneura fumiferana TaxID=7141 RepID=UPI003D15BB53
MDTDHTDSSVTSDKNRKRVCPSRKICRHCNKKRRRNKNKNPDYILTENDCNCTNDSVNKVDIQPIPTTTINNSTTNMNSPSPPQPTDTFRKVYVNTDCSPFVVHVQRMQDAPNDGTSIHPISFGNFLKKKSFKNIINGSVKRIGRNRVTLSFSHLDDANKFLNDKTLTDNKYKAFIPSFSVMRMGIVKGVPAEWSLEEILLNISVPLGTGKVIKARRLNYKTIVDGSAVWKPSQTVVLTFDGQVLPKRIFICYNALPVDLYIFPTIQCYNCCRYGHTKTQCRSKPCCYKCGQGHSGSTCDVEEDCVSCFLCTGHHFAISKQCPEFERQKNIKYLWHKVVCLTLRHQSCIIQSANLMQMFYYLLHHIKLISLKLNSPIIRLTHQHHHIHTKKQFFSSLEINLNIKKVMIKVLIMISLKNMICLLHLAMVLPFRKKNPTTTNPPLVSSSLSLSNYYLLQT